MIELFDNPVPNLGNADLQDRSRALNRRSENKDAAYVLCWLQQSLRAYDNPVIDAAISYGNARDLPVVVYHGIRQDYPHASDRLHYFLLGASRDLQRGCAERGVRCETYVQTPGNPEKGLVYRLAEKAAAVFTEDHPSFVAKWQTDSFASKSDRLVIAVDAARLVPIQILPNVKSRSAFRKANDALQEKYGAVIGDVIPQCLPYGQPLIFKGAELECATDAALKKLIADCDIDHSLWICPEFPPTRGEALQRLETFVREHLNQYRWNRNNPAMSGSGSKLSPYLHFGILGPRELYRAITNSQVHEGAIWKYLDESVTWREWYHYLAYKTENIDTFDALPSSAKKTLLEHAGDPRENLYDLGDLIHGKTHDDLWNAAQKQWLLTGYMHNNLRMYWAKKLIEWTADPVTAWNTACYMNDRLSLDGRDPATYGNMRWCFGGAKPGTREIPVYGWVAPKSSAPVMKRDGVAAWVKKWNAMFTPWVNVHARLPYPSCL